MSFSYLIIDKNIDNANRTKLLFDNFPNYSCAGIVSDVQKIVEHLYKFKPQLVLLNLPNDIDKNTVFFATVVDLYQYTNEIPYLIALFDTDHFAMQCIQSGFSDYIINPLQLHQLGKSLFKFERRNPINNLKNICIKSHSDYHFVPLKDIVYLNADNTTTDLILQNGKRVNAFKTLKYFENSLPFYFFRIHKSYIVNFHYVTRIHMVKSNCYLNNGEIISFSKTYKDNMEEIIRQICQ